MFLRSSIGAYSDAAKLEREGFGLAAVCGFVIDIMFAFQGASFEDTRHKPAGLNTILRDLRGGGGAKKTLHKRQEKAVQSFFRSSSVFSWPIAQQH